MLGEKDIIAEDLGFLTPEVHALLRESGYPGMKILEFAFDRRDGGNDYLPHTRSWNCVTARSAGEAQAERIMPQW